MKPQMLHSRDPRRSILDLLKKKDHTIKELCEELRLSPTAVRQHLTILERDDLIKKRALKEKTGRPKHLYSLTPKAEYLFPKRYENLLEGLLQETIELKGREEARRMMEAVAKKKAIRHKPDFRGKNLHQRLQQLVKLLNELGAYAEYSREKDGFVLKTYNCVFAGPAVKFDPLICCYDQVFFETLLERKITKKRSQTRGEKYCLFKIKGLHASPLPEPPLNSRGK